MRTRAYSPPRPTRAPTRWPCWATRATTVPSCHASTVGPIDDDQRFYLESRGIPPTEAERLVVSGYFADVLDRMPVPPAIFAHLRSAVDARLDQVVALSSAGAPT